MSSRGFLNPAVGAALALQARGHRVGFLTGRTCEDLLRRQSLDLIVRSAVGADIFDPALWFNPSVVALQVKYLEAACSSFVPDVIVAHELGLAALLVASRQRIPLGIVGLAAYMWRSGCPAGRRRVTEIIAHYNALRAMCGLSGVAESNEESLLGDLFMLRSTPRFECVGGDLPSAIRFVGAALWEDEHEEDAEMEDWLATAAREGRPLIYAQIGRLFDHPPFFSELASAADRLGARVALSAERMDSSSLSDCPSVLVRKYLPQSRVLRSAGAAVLTANTTSVLGAIEQAVPCVLIPGGAEQPEVAKRCAAAGFARVIQPSEASGERFVGELTRVFVEEEFRRRAEETRRDFSTFRGLESVVAHLEALEPGTSREMPASQAVSVGAQCA
jgi:UDP:flavonoid glycosyltransferase YjiC (YdhE family)